MTQTVLFDFDGTLFDTGEGILRSVQYALEGFGIHETDMARLRKFVGPPLFDSFTELYGMQPEQAQAATERYRERYQPIGVYECEIYPGIPELLAQLRAARAEGFEDRHQIVTAAAVMAHRHRHRGDRQQQR